MFYNESLASMKSITAKEKLEFIFKFCDWLPKIPYQVEVLANNRHWGSDLDLWYKHEIVADFPMTSISQYEILESIKDNGV